VKTVLWFTLSTTFARWAKQTLARNRVGENRYNPVPGGSAQGPKRILERR